MGRAIGHSAVIHLNLTVGIAGKRCCGARELSVMEQVLCCVNLSNFRDTVVDDRVACDDDTWLAEGHVSRGHRSLAGAIDGDLVALTRRYPCCTRTLPTNVNSVSVTSLLSALTSRSESVGGMLVSILANGSMNCPSHCRHRLSTDVTGTESSGCQSSNGRTVRSLSSSAIVCWVETPLLSKPRWRAVCAAKPANNGR